MDLLYETVSLEIYQKRIEENAKIREHCASKQIIERKRLVESIENLD